MSVVWVRAKVAAPDHIAFAVLAAAAGTMILFLFSGRSWFWRDEWQFILGRPLTNPATWLLPNEEHIVLIHAAVFSALVAIFGTVTYLPYLLVLVVTHIAFVAAVYVFVDRHVGRTPALVVAAILVLLGNAGLNIVWAFQMGPNAAAALAMWAILLIRQRPGWSAVLFSVGVLTGGFTLFFVPAAVLYGWSRKAFLAASTPVMVYGIWFVLIGRDAIVHHDNASSIPVVFHWLTDGIAASASAVTGLGPFGFLLLVAAMPLLLRHPDPHAAMVGPVGLLTEYVILGLRRDGLNVPAGWQYVYFGATFALITFAMAWLALPRWGRPVAATVAVVAVISNVVALVILSYTWPVVMAARDPLCSLCSIP